MGSIFENKVQQSDATYCFKPSRDGWNVQGPSLKRHADHIKPTKRKAQIRNHFCAANPSTQTFATTTTTLTLLHHPSYPTIWCVIHMLTTKWTYPPCFPTFNWIQSHPQPCRRRPCQWQLNLEHNILSNVMTSKTWDHFDGESLNAKKVSRQHLPRIWHGLFHRGNSSTASPLVGLYFYFLLFNAAKKMCKYLQNISNQIIENTLRSAVQIFFKFCPGIEVSK